MDRTPPTAPTGFRQEFSTSDSAVLAWDPSSDNVGVVSYGVYDAGILVASTPEPRRAFSGLACGKTYSYSIDAADAAGNRSDKAAATVSTAACADTQPPTMPAPVSVVDASSSAVSVAWPAATDNVGVDHYNVYRGNTAVAQTVTTTSTVAGLACGASYTIGVTAQDAAGNASAPASTTAQTDPCAALARHAAADDALRARCDRRDTDVDRLGWSASSDNVGVTGYTVYRDGTVAGGATDYVLLAQRGSHAERPTRWPSRPSTRRATAPDRARRFSRRRHARTRPLRRRPDPCFSRTGRRRASRSRGLLRPTTSESSGTGSIEREPSSLT